jgi:dolichyl-diphosphooligosaccharide--protein glycosyltransferase
MALALGIRSLGFEFVFVGDEVVFPPADAQYHLRRAFYTFVNFPAVLLFDPYINYPGGASVPWAPLFDFVLGSVARLLADTPRGFEQVAAWTGPPGVR